jgi:hypothetical protein
MMPIHPIVVREHIRIVTLATNRTKRRAKVNANWPLLLIALAVGYFIVKTAL